jgi:hypothetical protein
MRLVQQLLYIAVKHEQICVFQQNSVSNRTQPLRYRML